MNVAIGADHAGLLLKPDIIQLVIALGHSVIDCGAAAMIPDDDYPDYAKAVAERISTGAARRGILLCGSGVGASVAANKFHGIRAALCHDTFSAHQGVEDDDMNVLCLGSRVIGSSLAGEIVTMFLRAEFSGADRHKRRLAKIRDFDRAR